MRAREGQLSRLESGGLGSGGSLLDARIGLCRVILVVVEMALVLLNDLRWEKDATPSAYSARAQRRADARCGRASRATRLLEFLACAREICALRFQLVDIVGKELGLRRERRDLRILRRDELLQRRQLRSVLVHAGGWLGH